MAPSSPTRGTSNSYVVSIPKTFVTSTSSRDLETLCKSLLAEKLQKISFERPYLSKGKSDPIQWSQTSLGGWKGKDILHSRRKFKIFMRLLEPQNPTLD